MQTILVAYIFILIMNSPKNKKISERNHHSPLFVDTEFVPSDLHYFTLYNRKITDIPTVLPYPNDEFKLHDLEAKISRIEPKQHIYTTLDLGCEDSLSSSHRIKDFKYKACRKRIDGEEISTSAEGGDLIDFGKIMNSRSLENESCERCDICCIMWAKKEDVFHLSFRWKSEKAAREEILAAVNQRYDANLKLDELQFSILTFVCKSEEGRETNIKYIPKPIKSLKEYIFEANKLACISIDISSNRISTSKLMSPTKQVVSSINVDNENFFQVILPSGETFRLSFEKYKQYQVRQILGILGVENPESKGLKVLNQIFQPTALVYSIGYLFKERAIINFITAIIVQDIEVFLEEVSKSPPLNEAQIKKLAEEDYRLKDAAIRRNGPLGSKKQLTPLTLFNSQCQIHSNKEVSFNYLYHIIHKFIRNYFTHYNNFFDSSISSRFVKSLIDQLRELPIHKGDVYRKVGYELHYKEGDVIEFNNFVMTSMNPAILQVNTPRQYASKITVIKLFSESGRVVGNYSSFEGLQEVIFPPYTKFEVIKRIEGNEVELTMREVTQTTTFVKSNLILWLDNKRNEQQGAAMISKLRSIKRSIFIYLFISTAELYEWIQTHCKLVKSQEVKTILITNMRRTQNGKENNTAGIETINLSRLMIPSVFIILYIGNIEFTKKSLVSHKIDPVTVAIINEPTTLANKVKQLCDEPIQKLESTNKIETQNWQDYFSFVKENQSDNPLQLVKPLIPSNKSPPKLNLLLQKAQQIDKVAQKIEKPVEPQKPQKYQKIEKIEQNINIIQSKSQLYPKIGEEKWVKPNPIPNNQKTQVKPPPKKIIIQSSIIGFAKEDDADLDEIRQDEPIKQPNMFSIPGPLNSNIKDSKFKGKSHIYGKM